MKKRCICGHAQSFPLCDGSHQSNGWSCAQQMIQHQKHVVISSYHYQSLAQKWAYHLNGKMLESADRTLHCDRLWIFCDGSDIDQLILQQKVIRAKQVSLVAINSDPSFLYRLGTIDDLKIINDDLKIPLWTQLQVETQKAQKEEQRSIFLSHAVADEATLLTMLTMLRNQLGHHVFSCSDSIAAGGNWYMEISEALNHSDYVLCVLSESFSRSTFCGFEVGMARALKKNIRLVSIDDTLPPSYAQDIQMLSVPRYMRTHTWLTFEEALLECMLKTQAQG